MRIENRMEIVKISEWESKILPNGNRKKTNATRKELSLLLQFHKNVVFAI